MKYHYVSIGMNCISRKSFDIFYNKKYSQPYYVFDWSVAGDMKDCAKAINNNFKNYFDIIRVKNSKNEIDLEKIKILTGNNSKIKLQRENNYVWREQVHDSHKYYPSIIEYHYDLNIKEDKEKILRRIDRFEYLIKNKKPILFVRIIIHPYIELTYYFFKISYIDGLKNCYEFLETLNSIENIKVLFIHYFYNPKVKKDIINTTSSLYIDSYEIISNYNTKHWADRYIMFKFIKPILDKYDFII